MRGVLLFLATFLCAILTDRAQAQMTPLEIARTIAGDWELSNADRDQACPVTLKTDSHAHGFTLQVGKECAQTLPFTRGVTAWGIGRHDVIRLVDQAGKTIIEFSEVESGLYEGLRSGEGLFFLQNMAAAEGTRERTADQMSGDWVFMRAGKPICTLSLVPEAASTDTYALKAKPGCDAVVTRFAPAAWKMDRGQLLIMSAKNEVWRFEEAEPPAWRRIPEGKQPLQLVKQ